MGVVYKARDTHLDRPVAIKVLSPEAVSDPERKRRFVREARTASALNHPNIVHVYDIGQSDGTDFMAMEFVHGKTLDELGREGLSLSEALGYASQIAAALARAHDAGIVHRDLKPANIMVTTDGLVKVLDFGLAKLSEPSPETGDAALTQTVHLRTEPGMVFGTVEYMSPEQAEGKSVDARSDIFSFGTMLYEMTTGRRPFQGDSKLAVLSAILSKDPVPLREIRTGLPPRLDQILSRCLQKEQERRFQNMNDLKAAIDEVRDALRVPSKASRAELPAARARFISRRRWLWSGAAAGVAIALWVAIPLARRGFPGGSRGKLVAVLPFQSPAAGPAGQAFSEGLVETLSRNLCWLNQFQPTERVLPPGDIHGDAALGPTEARNKLGADLVLTGVLRRTGAIVHLALSLRDTRTGHELKRIGMDLSLRDAARSPQALVKKVAGILGLRVTSRAEQALALGNTAVPEAYDSYLQAYGYLKHTDQAGDLDHAISLFQAALEKDPSYGRAYAGLGEAYWAKSSLTSQKQWAEKARESCLRAIAMKADLARVHLVLGKIDSGTGQPGEAVEQFRKALQLDPLSIAAQTSLGEAYEAMGQLSDSEGTYLALIKLWPDYLVPYSYLGAFYVGQGRYKDAEPVFRKYVELAPENALGYQNLGAVYHFMGRTDDAAAMMKKSLSIKPSARGYTNLGTLYYFEGDYSDAVPLMEKATEMEPDNYLYWGNLGDAYRWAPGDQDRAPEAYRQAIKLAGRELAMNPQDAGLRSSLAGYYAKLQDQAKALAEIAQARRLAPMNPEVLFRAALVDEITGRRDQALGALHLALQSGYSIQEARQEPELKELRKDPRYKQLDKGIAADSAGRQSKAARKVRF